jgi:hypothetical protein
MKARHLVGGATVALVLLGGLAAPAFAADSGSQVATGASVIGGDLTATLAGNITFAAVPVSHAAQSPPAQATSVVVNDLTGTAAGWDATILASGLGDGSTGTIGAANVGLSSFGALTATSGVTTGIAPGTAGPIDTAVALVSAAAGDGVGDYTQAFSLSLNVPGDSQTGTYAGTLVVTIAPPA